MVEQVRKHSCPIDLPNTLVVTVVGTVVSIFSFEIVVFVVSGRLNG